MYHIKNIIIDTSDSNIDINALQERDQLEMPWIMMWYVKCSDWIDAVQSGVIWGEVV